MEAEPDLSPVSPTDHIYTYAISDLISHPHEFFTNVFKVPQDFEIFTVEDENKKRVTVDLQGV